MGLPVLSNRNDLIAWLDNALIEQEKWYTDEDEVPSGENGKQLCSEAYLDALVFDIFGNFNFEFDGSESYFADYIVSGAARLMNETGLFIAITEITSPEPPDMIQLESNDTVNNDALLKAFTNPDRDVLTGKITANMFSLSSTGNVAESMTIFASAPAYTSGTMSYDDFKTDPHNKLKASKKTLDNAKKKIDAAYDTINAANNRISELRKAGYDVTGFENQAYAAIRFWDTANIKHKNAAKLFEEVDTFYNTMNEYSSSVLGSIILSWGNQLDKYITKAYAAYNTVADTDNAADTAVTKAKDTLAATNAAWDKLNAEKRAEEERAKEKEERVNSTTTILNKDEEVFIAVVAAEAIGQGELAWKAVASVIMNRVGKREWSACTTPRAVVERAGDFSCLNGSGSAQYHKAINYLSNRAYDNNDYEKLISAVMLIYKKEISYVTDAQLYYSPRSMNPPGSAPRWASSSQLVKVKIDGVNDNDFCFYKYK